MSKYLDCLYVIRAKLLAVFRGVNCFLEGYYYGSL